MQDSGSDEDESRRQWEADKPLSERLKVKCSAYNAQINWIIWSFTKERHCHLTLWITSDSSRAVFGNLRFCSEHVRIN